MGAENKEDGGVMMNGTAIREECEHSNDGNGDGHDYEREDDAKHEMVARWVCLG